MRKSHIKIHDNNVYSCIAFVRIKSSEGKKMGRRSPKFFNNQKWVLTYNTCKRPPLSKHFLWVLSQRERELNPAKSGYECLMAVPTRTEQRSLGGPQTEAAKRCLLHKMCNTVLLIQWGVVGWGEERGINIQDTSVCSP